MLDEPTAFIDGYTSYFSFSRKKTGYSGVATFCKTDFTPIQAEEGLGKSFIRSMEFDKKKWSHYTENVKKNQAIFVISERRREGKKRHTHFLKNFIPEF